MQTRIAGRNNILGSIPNNRAKENTTQGTHTHAWRSPKESDTGEKIHWCESCDATKDSDGGIIN